MRRTVAQVWNKQNHRLISTFEYENENAYKACQKIIEEKVMPKAQASYTIKARNNRGVIFVIIEVSLIFKFFLKINYN